MSREKVPLRVLWASCLAALLILVAKLSESMSGPPNREQLVRIIGSYRISEGRLTGGFPWAPVHGEQRLEMVQDLRRAAGALDRSPAKRSPEVQGNLGLLALLNAQYSLAIDLFARAASKTPGEPALLADLSVAQFAAAGAEGKPYLVLQALDTAQQALRIDPKSPESSFNFAVATERLHLTLTARKAWEDFLDVETDPQWRREAEQRLRKLREPTAGERWLILRGKLGTAAGHDYEASLQTALTHFPQQLRQWGQEELLSRWATACETGPSEEAERLYRAISEIGRALAEQKGERSIDNASTAISKESCGPGNRLASGHKTYAQGVSLYNQSRYSEAAAPLRQAETAFKEAGSKGALLWTRLWLGATEYFARRHDLAEGRFMEILRDPALAGFPALRGRALWCRGQLALVHGNLDRALSLFGEARKWFEATGEMENAGAMDALLADALRRAGRLDEAWSERLQALQRLSQYPESYRLHNLLYEGPDALLSEGLPFAAQVLQTEGAQVAVKFGGKPSSIAANLLLGARLRTHWSGDEALATLAEARSAIRQIDDDQLREAFGFESFLVENEVQATRSPQQRTALSKVIQYYEGLRQPINAAEARLQRARAEIQTGNLAGAEHDLATGIGYQEAMATEVSDQAAFAEEWQGLFEEMIRFHAVLRKDPERAFEFVERSRIPPCQAAAPMPCIRVRSLEEVREAVPKGVALLQYFVMPERLLTWRFHAGVVDFWEAPVDAERLEIRIESLIRDLEEGRVSRGALILYDLLLRQPLIGLPVGTELVFVPDSALNLVPFAALRDKESSRYLIEDHSLAYAPSASSLLAAKRQVPYKEKVLSSITTVGFSGSRLSGSMGESLPRLPFAVPEAVEIGEIYPERRVLTGSEATRDSFTRSLEESEIVHFAGHGLFNSESPLLSGIVLADPNAPNAGKVFSAQDIPNLRDARLRLLVLSACDTFSGSRRRVGGLNGIAAAFLARGVPEVVSTQWSVEDSFSRGILRNFHREVANGAKTSEALRDAQRVELNQGGNEAVSPKAWSAYRLTRRNF